jgi:hypothetical protein
MSEKASRHALIVGVSNYREPKLKRLRAPAADATALARALRNPAIGDFDVVVSSDETEGTLRRRIATFFTDRLPEDLLLLHFSCHGIKYGRELYLAASDTELGLLTATGIPSSWLSEQMTDCRSKSIVLLLDCCFSGSFPFGMRARAAGEVDLQGHLDGRGRAIITASNAMEYAYEGDELSGSATPSIFTRTIVEGLETGEADRDGDKWISVDDLYDYVYDRVKILTNAQTPRKMSTLEGSLRIARSVYQPPITAVDLDSDLIALTKNRIPSARANAVAELATLLRTGAPGESLAARQQLEAMTDDDSRMVAQAVAVALATIDQAPAESRTPRGGPTSAVSRPPEIRSATKDIAWTERRTQQGTLPDQEQAPLDEPILDITEDPGSRYGHAGDLLTAPEVSVDRVSPAAPRATPAFPVTTPAVGPALSETTELARADPTDAAELLAAGASVSSSAFLTTAGPRREAATSHADASTTRSMRKVIAACAGVAGVAMVLVLTVVGGSGQAHAARYTAGDLTVSARSQWRRAPAESRVVITDPLSLSDGRTLVTIGALPKPGRTAAVPSAVLRALGDPRTSAVMSTDAGPARRYLWNSGVALYVISTSGGELAAACTASPFPQPIARTLADCAEIVSTAAVHGASVEFPGVPAGLAARIGGALRTRSASTVALRSQLDASSLHTRQSALLQLVGIDNQSAATLDAIVTSARYSAAIHTLRVALEAEAHDGRTTARDELPVSRGRFDVQRTAFDQTSDRLVSAVHAVGVLGIAVPTLRAIRLPSLPAPEPSSTLHTTTPTEVTETRPSATRPSETRPSETRPEKEKVSSGSA